MADIQLQLQNIVQLAKVTNTQLVEIETTILRASDVYRIQTAGDIFSISYKTSFKETWKTKHIIFKYY